MAVREFDGTDDEIRWAIDALSGMTFGTVAAIFKVPAAAGGNPIVFGLHTSTGTFRAQVLGYSGANQRANLNNGSNFVESPDNSLTDDVWNLVIYRKATGAVTGRFSIYDHTAVDWSHANGNTTLADWTAPGASGTVRMSFESTSDFPAVRLAVAAMWSNEVHWTADASGDTTIEAAGLEDSLQSWIDETPDALWAFNQASTGDPVNDLVGNSDQTNIVGTTVINGDDPPGFSFELGGGGPELMPRAVIVAG